MNEIVKYDNYMNELKLKDFTSTDLDFLMTLCSKMRDMDTKEVIFDFAEIKKITNHKINSNERFVSELERMNRKLMKVTCRLKTQDRIIMFVLFPTFEINLNNNTLIVAVNEKFKFILNELVKGFTRFELVEFIKLDSKYSKNLYRLLKQFRTTGKLEINDIEDFKEKLDSPKSYKAKDFKRFVLDVAINELKEKECFRNLKVEPKTAKKRGSPVIGYTFTFQAEQLKRKPTPKADEAQEPKVENAETRELQNRHQLTPQTKKTTKQFANHRFNQFEQREYTEEEMKEIVQTNQQQHNEKEVSEHTQKEMQRLREKYPNTFKK